MPRGEAMAIIGAYSRSGFYAERTPGGFLVETMGYRSFKEARRDTGVNWLRYQTINRLSDARYYIGQHGTRIA